MVAVAYVTAHNHGNNKQEQELPGATLGVRLVTRKRGQMVVQQVSSDATKLGLKVGDWILKVDETPIHSRADFVSEVAKRNSGDKIRLVVDRAGTLVSVNRRYTGPIGVTKLETAASQGIDFNKAPARAEQSWKQQVVQSAPAVKQPEIQPKKSLQKQAQVQKQVPVQKLGQQVQKQLQAASALATSAKKAQSKPSVATLGMVRKPKTGPPKSAPAFLKPAGWIEL